MDIAHLPVDRQGRLQDPAQARSGRIFLALLAGYFLLQIVIRLSLSDSLDLDEAEQALVSQRLQLGYGTQPPLYSWIQWVLFQVFGLNLFALSALKNLLLFSTYACMFFMARPLVGQGAAIAASASLLLFPQIAWESQRDLTHSVLMTGLACATLWCYFALLRRPVWGRYILFGFLVGLGLQSKYNYAMFAAGLAAASLLVEEHRRLLWNRRMLAAAGIALLCILPHGLWVLGHMDAAAGGTLDKMRDGAQRAGYLSSVATGLSSMLLAALAFATPFWLVYGFLGWRGRGQERQERHPQAGFFLVLYAAFFLLMTLLVLSGEVGKIKDRWMQPLLFSLPLACFMLWPALSRPQALRRILQVTAGVAIIILLALPGRVLLGPALGKHVRAHHPYPELSAELDRRFPEARTLVAGERLTGGNLYFQQPARHTLLLKEALAARPVLHGDVLLVVRTGTETGWLERFRQAYPDAAMQRQGRIALPYRYGSDDTMSFDYALIRAGSL
ncbi:MAG: glycosyltransferase family 39 protein [Noviherbaspirillum sp.]